MREQIKMILKDAGENQLNLQCNATIDLLAEKIMNVINPSLAKAIKQLDEKNVKPYKYEDGE